MLERVEVESQEQVQYQNFPNSGEPLMCVYRTIDWKKRKFWMLPLVCLYVIPLLKHLNAHLNKFYFVELLNENEKVISVPTQLKSLTSRCNDQDREI